MRSVHLAAAAAFCLVVAGATLPSATAGQTTFITPAGTLMTVPAVSLREARFHTVIRQDHDYSCGSAAIATLLTYHYDHAVDENMAFASMYEVGDHAAVERVGFSMEEMQKYLQVLGYRSAVYKLSLDSIAQVGVPGIALISSRGYNHFVVIKGVKDDDVLVGDPAAGLKTIPRTEFESMWQGLIFVIRDDMATATAHFNRPEEWMVRRKAPFGTALDRQGLATFSTMLPEMHQF